MPPRSSKRARLTPSASTKTSPEAETATPTPSSPAPRSSRSGTQKTLAPPTSTTEDSPAQSDSASPEPSSPWMPDAWTPAQETALFKALIKHKPTGMHKHFHMLSISSYLQAHGHSYPSYARESTTKTSRSADAQNSSKSTHTSIPGIWEKLSSLYDLDALDERQDAYALPQEPDGEIQEFRLPGGEPTIHGPPSSARQDGPNRNASTTNEAKQKQQLDDDEPDEDEAFYSAHVWARRFPKPELESDMELSSPEAEFLPLRRGRDGGVEAVNQLARGVRTGTKKGGGDASKAAGGASTPAATPASAVPASVKRRSNRRESARISGTPVTDTAEEDKDGALEVEDSVDEEDDVEAEEEEDADETAEGDQEEEEEEEAGTEVGGQEEEDDEIEDDDDDDDEDELGDRSDAPAARSTRSSARGRRR